MTNAALINRLAIMSRLLAGAQASLADGIWNPHFCSADCGGYGLSILEDLMTEVRRLEKDLKTKKGGKPLELPMRGAGKADIAMESTA